MYKRFIFFWLILSPWFSYGCEDSDPSRGNTSEDTTAVLISQPLAGTDELGRVLPLNNSVGNPKSGRQVGIFYFLWQGDATAQHYWDLSEIIANHPEVLEDYDIS